MSTSLSIESSDAISSLRSDLRQQIKDDREKRRHRSVDSIRLGIGEVTEQLGNLRNYSTKDVTELAGRIKQQKHASTDDLNCLAHAFIQSVENITCFLNITGALNVLVKELTGNHADRQVLATECLCNLSLGTEIACEKLTLHAGTYLMTFLNSQSERLALTSLWTITNLSMAGEKPLRILLSQEILRTLLALKRHSAVPSIIEDSYTALQAIVNEKNRSLLRPNDLSDLLQWIQEQETLTNSNVARIAFNALKIIDFKFDDEIDATRIIEMCVRSMKHIAAQSVAIEYQSTAGQSDLSIILSLILNITANFCLNHPIGWEHFINYGFLWPRWSMVEVFNQLFALQTNVQHQKQLIWFAGGLVKNPTTAAIVKYLEDDHFIGNLKVPNLEISWE